MIYWPWVGSGRVRVCVGRVQKIDPRPTLQCRHFMRCVCAEKNLLVLNTVLMLILVFAIYLLYSYKAVWQCSVLSVVLMPGDLLILLYIQSTTCHISIYRCNVCCLSEKKEKKGYHEKPGICHLDLIYFSPLWPYFYYRLFCVDGQYCQYGVSFLQGVSIALLCRALY